MDCRKSGGCCGNQGTRFRTEHCAKVGYVALDKATSAVDQKQEGLVIVILIMITLPLKRDAPSLGFEHLRPPLNSPWTLSSPYLPMTHSGSGSTGLNIVLRLRGCSARRAAKRTAQIAVDRFL